MKDENVIIITLKELRKEIKLQEIGPFDLFTEEQIKADPVISKHLETVREEAIKERKKKDEKNVLIPEDENDLSNGEINPLIPDNDNDKSDNPLIPD